MLILLHQFVPKKIVVASTQDYKQLPGRTQKYGNTIILWELKFKRGTED